MTDRRAAERAVLAVAAKQRTIVGHEQLLRCGLGSRAIAYRVSTGRLQEVFRRVYTVGCGALPPLAVEQAALLACGSDAFLSHTTAAALWGILPARPTAPEVTVVGRTCRWREGMSMHRTASIDPRELGQCDGLPVSSPARALLELAATRARDELERAFDEAFGRERVTPIEVEAVLTRHEGARGSARLRALLEEGTDIGFLRSRGERAFRRLIGKAGLSQPVANVPIGPYVADFLWREERLIVEFDGYDFHRGREKFESDRARDTALKAAGFEVIRFTWRQVLYQPELVLFRLGQVLALIGLRARAG